MVQFKNVVLGCLIYYLQILYRTRVMFVPHSQIHTQGILGQNSFFCFFALNSIDDKPSFQSPTLENVSTLLDCKGN